MSPGFQVTLDYVSWDLQQGLKCWRSGFSGTSGLARFFVEVSKVSNTVRVHRCSLLQLLQSLAAVTGIVQASLHEGRLLRGINKGG
jgi:hypothetical protein